MKKLAFLCIGLWANAAFATPSIVSLASDKATYHVGDAATLTALLSTRPDNKDMELDVVGDLDGAALSVTRETDFDFYSTATMAALGSHSWHLVIYLQDARLAHDLKSTILATSKQIAADNSQLQSTTDPTQRQALLNDIAAQQNLFNAATTELGNIRTKVQEASLAIVVN